jgi:hypothetical protein
VLRVSCLPGSSYIALLDLPTPSAKGAGVRVAELIAHNGLCQQLGLSSAKLCEAPRQLGHRRAIAVGTPIAERPPHRSPKTSHGAHVDLPPACAQAMNARLVHSGPLCVRARVAGALEITLVRLVRGSG